MTIGERRTVVLVLTFMLLGASPAERRVLRVADRSDIPLSALPSELAGARAVFIGELHDVEDHHAIQLEVIRRMHGAGAPLVIGLEMFRSDQQDDLDRWTAGRMDEREFRRVYERNWRNPWELYRNIFLFAREKSIPLAGLNVPRAVLEKVAREGFAGLGPEERAQLPRGISCEVDDRYREFIRLSHGLHGAHGRSFDRFCELQMVRDQSMARHIADRLQRDGRAVIVVLAGSGHAWRRGIPEQLRRMTTGVSAKVVMPLIEGKIERATVTDGDADFVVL